MSVRRVVVCLLGLALATFLWATSGPPRARPAPPGTFSFAVLGDAPYYWWEDLRFRLVLRAIDEHDLSSVIHVGDVFWKPCTDAMYRRVRNRFDGLRHPVLYTPGDNEWTDCWEQRAGGYRPLERLAVLRRTFFSDPEHSLGRRRIAVTGQRGFVENVRWQHERVVFATIHLTGSSHGTRSFPGRTAADDTEAEARMDAATAWMREAFAEARARGAVAIVLAYHANLSSELRPGHARRAPYDTFLFALGEEAEKFGRPVLLTHGDAHQFIVDHPLASRSTGRRLANVTRMEVPGSPDVGWVRVTVDSRARSPFTFERHVVPSWKYW